MGKRRTYTEEFKRDAVELNISSDKNCTEIAEDLGINYNNLIRWRKKYRNNGELAFPGKGNQKLTSEKQKIKNLEDELKETKLERDILKKAVAIFSKKPK
ncbi:transposase [Halanaerobium congolense]|jgi:transposase|uniref:Transposase n=1 Tax=Halanaerobium congolense TaxID=54121 RepID=A0A1G6T5Z4_9FIRM|nr:transposase [Halanaerobium congolense]SDD24431.1 transposase [Halanaerobium congolense]SDF85181.1 transposase [Halanaerobium congolense]SET12868.1 transposase [Halanaerobium congolense]SFP54638.1 transposase [Halanaerobium congolense]